MELTIRKIPELLRSAISRKCWYLIFSVTNICNQRCRMCFNRDMDKPSDDILKLDEIKKIAASFDSLYQLTLSGGEPLLRQDLPEIVSAFCSRRPVPRITLPSNGQLPELLEETVRRLLSENPESNINVALSLDGIAGHHDNIRGVRGAFDKFTESFERLSRLRKAFPHLTMVVASTISSFNQEHTEELLAFIENSPEPQMFGMMMARGMTREPEASDIAREKFLTDLERLHGIQKPSFSRMAQVWNEVCFQNRVDTIRSGRMIDPCKAGVKLLVLSHNGFLWPCEPLQSGTHYGEESLEGGFCFGNLRNVDYDANRLLESVQARKIRSFIKEKRCSCTFECALLNNFALNPCNFFKVVKQLL